MRIRHNLPAKNAYRSYRGNAKALQDNLQKLSSGYAINKAADDAAGLAVSEKMRMQITGLEQAERNAKDGVSLLNTAEGALAELHDMLNRAFSLAEQSANGTYDDDTDRVQLQSELDSLSAEIDRIAVGTNFNGIKLLHTDSHPTGDNPTINKPNANTYIDADGNTMQIPANATALTGSETTISAGWYIVSGNVTFNSALTMNGDVHLILADGCVLKSENGGIDVSAGNSLTIYAQSDGANMGKLSAKGTNGHAGIGSERNVDSGAITINGGWVDATGSKVIDGYGGNGGGAGIGGGRGGTGTVTINGGTVTATDGEYSYGAGIGGGCNSAGTVTINGGTVTATSVFSGAGIGGGYSGDGDVTINGGTVTATSGSVGVSGGGAGIGGGEEGVGDVTISGGSVTADGGKRGAGIGGGLKGTGVVTINGGTVTADGGTAGAGIGGGEQGKGNVTIANEIEIVLAKGGVGGEHIGNGDNASASGSAKVNIGAGLTDTTENGYRKLYGAGTPPTNPDSPDAPALPDEDTIRLRIGVESFEILDIHRRDMCCVSLGIANISIAHQDDASDAMNPIKDAINLVSDYRGYLGALGNRLEHTINNLNNMRENITDAESTIRDTDVAEEMMKYTKNNILVQSAQAMLAQANQLPQGVLQLLG